MLIGPGVTVKAGNNIIVPITPPPTPHSYVFNGSGGYLQVGNGAVIANVTSPNGNANLGAPPYIAGSYVYCSNAALNAHVGDTFTADGQTCTIIERRAVADNLIFVGFTPRITAGVMHNGDAVSFGSVQPWALGTSWTIEFWSKATTSTVSTGLFPVLCQQPANNCFDIYYVSGGLYFGNNQKRVNSEPTPNVWTHVAIVNNAGTMAIYYNGISQTLVDSSSYNFTDTTDVLYVGTRGVSQYGQFFNGNITNIQILNRVIYTENFTPATTQPLVATGTQLLLTPNASSDYVDHSTNALPITNNAVTISTDYP